MTLEEAVARIRNHKIVHKMNEPRAIYISEALDMAIKALENQETLQKELEKIKAEIEEKMRKNNCDLYGYADSLVSIDEHISELKGETE